MNSGKPSKFELGKDDESNFGHTENEWGKQKDAQKIRIIEAYDLKWNIDDE